MIKPFVYKGYRITPIPIPPDFSDYRVACNKMIHKCKCTGSEQTYKEILFIIRMYHL